MRRLRKESRKNTLPVSPPTHKELRIYHFFSCNNNKKSWIHDFSWTHRRTEFTGKTSTLKSGKKKSESEVTQSCPTLCDPMDCSLPGSSVHGIFQASVLEWVAISFSRGSSQPRDQTWVSRIVGRCFTIWATREVSKIWINKQMQRVSQDLFPWNRSL